MSGANTRNTLCCQSCGGTEGLSYLAASGAPCASCREADRGVSMYRFCATADCFEIAIGTEGALCDDCQGDDR